MFVGKPSLCGMILIFMASTANAQTVYKFVDKNGNAVFSDTPVAGAEAVNIQPAATIQMAPVQLPPAEKPAKNKAVPYERVVITTPSHDTVFSNDPAPVVVTGTSTPGLQGRDQYRFVFNGQATETLSKPQYSFNSEERGSYTAVLEIVDNNLQVKARSAPVTFHVRRHSKLFKKPTAPGPIKR